MYFVKPAFIQCNYGHIVTQRSIPVVSSRAQWLTNRKLDISLPTQYVGTFIRYKTLAARARFLAVHHGRNQLKQYGSRCSIERPLGFAV